MGKQYFSLELNENNKVTKIIRILFGVVCVAVSIFWLIFNIKSLKSDGTLWITIIFLSGFGFYQIWAGLGYATKFIEIGSDYIRLKKSAMLPATLISAGDIEKIELFPLNVIFFLKSRQKTLLRFGTTYPERMELTKDALIEFASSNNINLELISEQL